ncbi:hypothetical protein DL96DRAFT_1718950 [Flagelloscypha sp. PMI_526]|nr:hypothetical protein DL96DRAFT_1718950 [Flagelloscypha sp. PMI_526]
MSYRQSFASDLDYMDDEQFSRLLATLNLQESSSQAETRSVESTLRIITLSANSGTIAISNSVSIRSRQGTPPPVYSAMTPPATPSRSSTRSTLPVHSFGPALAGRSTLAGNWNLPFNSAQSPGTASRKAYVVFRGQESGVFTNWSQTKRLVEGISGALHKSYPSLNIARSVYLHAKSWKLTAGNGSRVEQPPAILVATSREEAISRALAFDPMNVVRTFYVVTRGRIPGIYASWLEAALNVVGITGGRTEDYDSWEEANAAWHGFVNTGSIVQSLQ